MNRREKKSNSFQPYLANSRIMTITTVAPWGLGVKWGIGGRIMQLDWCRIKVTAGAWLTQARNVAGVAALAGLAVLLASQAANARREREVVAREGAALDREIERMKRANQALRDEVRALEAD